MAKQINLIPRITEEEQRRVELNKTTTLVSVLILVVALFLVTGSFAYEYYLKYNLDLMTQQSKEFEIELERERVKESLLKGIGSKVERLQTLYQSFPHLSKIFQSLTGLSRDNLSFTTFRIDKEGSVEFSVTTFSLSSLHLFINDFKTQAGILKLSDIQITDLSSSVGSGYKTSVRFKWSGDGKS